MFLHYSWTRWEKITFDQSFVSKHQFFLFENCRLGKKTRSQVVGTIKIFWGWEKQKPSLCNLKRKHLVKCLLLALISEFPWKAYDCTMSLRCSMSPYLTVCWKVGPWADIGRLTIQSHCQYCGNIYEN